MGNVRKENGEERSTQTGIIERERALIRDKRVLLSVRRYYYSAPAEVRAIACRSRSISDLMSESSSLIARRVTSLSSSLSMFRTASHSVCT
jgi:hypothetical protein